MLFGKFFDEITKPAQVVARAAASQAVGQVQQALTAETQALIDEATRRLTASLLTPSAQPTGFLAPTSTPTTTTV